MSVFHNPMLLSPSGASAFDTALIGKSVWLDGAADFLSVELGAKTRTRAVIGTWFQKNNFTTGDQTVFSKKSSGTEFAWRMIDQGSNSNGWEIFDYDGSAFQYSAESSMVFRDIGWYHIMISIDTTADAGSRLKFFVNGIDRTSTLTVATDYTEDDNISITGGSGHATQWGVGYPGNSQFAAIYLAQSFMLDDDSIQNSDVAVADILDSFEYGENGSQFGPKANADIAALASSASGSSFCLDYSDSSALGTDASSLGNDFTPTSMAAINQSNHTPSKTYMQLNARSFFGVAALSEGNTRVGVDVYDAIRGTKFASSGKKYLEVTINTVNNTYIGVANNSAAPTSFSSLNVACLQKGGDIYINAAIPAGTNGSSHAFVDDDVVGILIDADNKKFWQSINGQINSLDRTPDIDLSDSDVIAGTGGFDLTSLPGDDGFYTIHIGNSDGSTADVSVNTGHKAFAHTPPEGYTDWGSDNYTAPDHQGVDYYKNLLYTGNGTAIGAGGNAVTGVGFKPDWVFIKNRDGTSSDPFVIYDSVRGVTEQMATSAVEVAARSETTKAEGVAVFGDDGFTVGDDDFVNSNTESNISWNWLGSDGGSTTSPAGSLASTSSVSPAGNFSVVSYTGTGSATTVGHGLGGIPEFIWVKNRDEKDPWKIYHHRVASDPETDYMSFVTDGDAKDDATVWNDTPFTSSVFSIGTNVAVNTNTEKYIAYCFRSVPGVCRVGSFIGNSSANGPYLSFGFKPVWFLFRVMNSGETVGSWSLFDRARDPVNLAAGDEFAHPNVATNTYRSSGSLVGIDWLADGVKILSSHVGSNANTVVYMAMADIGGNGALPPIYGQ